jgi:trimethylamine--corrinoid protein Co-methyltransferase
MRSQYQLLNTEEKERIHSESLRILSEAGVRSYSSRSLEILTSHGAKVDGGSRITRLPSDLVERALTTAPASFTLGARNPSHDLKLPAASPRFCIDGTAAFSLDFDTGQHRYGTLRDIEASLRIFQQMDMGVMAWAPVGASDVPANARPLHEFFATARFCSKHGQHELHRLEQAPYLIEGLTAIAGSRQVLIERHPYSLVYCPVAPLTHDGAMLDAYLALGEIDMPVLVMPMPVPGTTGPASLFSNLCQANAEALSSIVIFQLAHPGRPMVFSSATGTMDFRTGAYLGGTSEMGLMSAALAEMARFYHLPSSSAGCTADAHQPGADAVLQKIFTTLPPMLAEADIIIGFGEIEGDQLLVLEQIVVDNEIAHYCERIARGVESGEDKVLTEDVLQVGPGGNFLAQRSTRAAARSDEFLPAGLIDRHNREAWLELGRPDMYAAAREKVRSILDGPLVDPLPEEVNRELDALLTAAERQIPQ